jgi:hypothetical protein
MARLFAKGEKYAYYHDPGCTRGGFDQPGTETGSAQKNDGYFHQRGW